jgi:predicted TIM-barrel fold metal-dependent hydrolase
MGVLSDSLPLVDAHCHALASQPSSPVEFGVWMTEADHLRPDVDPWDSSVGLAVRRWCAPALGLAPYALPDDYLRARDALGSGEATRRLLRSANLSCLLVDTGLPGDPARAAEAAGASWREVIRLESVAEQVAVAGVSAGAFAATVRDRLADATAGAVAVKSILAYRHGLDVDPARPTDAEVAGAAGEWLARRDAEPAARLDHPVLLRFLLWAGVDTGLPVQVHTGFGDRDLALPRADPSLLQPFLAAAEPAGVPIVLLHCYPYHRQAGWLAQVYPHVFVDVGLTVGQVGGRADAVLGEFLELVPFGKLLFSTDGCRLPELYLVGAAQFRHSLGRVLAGLVDDGFPAAEAERVARMVGRENAARVYALPEQGG